MSEDHEHKLPTGWELRRLSDIAEINPRFERPPFDDDMEVTFVPMRAVNVEGGGLVRPEARPYREVRKGYTAFLPGDVIMAKITPCMENGKVAVVPVVPGGICFGSTEFHVIRPRPGVSPIWVKRFLLAPDVRRAAQRAMTGGVGQMRVPVSFLESIQIPIAPISEQQRIADAIDEIFSDLDAGVAALERVRSRLRFYRASVLRGAVEGTITEEWRTAHTDVEPASELLKRILAERRLQWEKDYLAKLAAKGQKPPKNWAAKYKKPVEPDISGLPSLPKGWCWATVDQASGAIQYGTSAKTNGDSAGIPVLRMGNITSDGALALDSLKFLPASHHEFPALLLRKGDVLFNRTNSAELVGKSALYSGTPASCSFASYLIRIRVLAGLLPQIVMNSLNSALGRRWIKGVVAQTVGQANVNGTKLAAFTFPLPPFVEQEVIVDLVEGQLSVIDHLESDIDAKLKSAHSLRQSILHRSFTGQLVPQNPNDQPVSELLERIAAERRVRRNDTRPHSATRRERPARSHRRK